MHYRPFGKLDFQVSALGFGAMRLPVKNHRVDEDESDRMLRFAVEAGCNYVDTAWPYHDGQSEEFLGRALKGGLRQKVKLATKLPSWEVKKADDFDRFLDAQLARLQTDALDFYLLHSLGKDSWEKLSSLGALDWAEKARKAGKFRYLGFSFHDDLDAFKTVIDACDWDMCQIQYNYMDVESQAGAAGLRYAAAKNIAVVVMEPLLGGRLTTPPPSVQSIWNDGGKKRTPAAWALDWLWDQPEVACVLSGMSTMDQVRENVALAGVSRTNSLTQDECALIGRVREEYRKLIVIPCTNCRYCQPCPHHVDIPGNIGAYNDGVMYHNPGAARGWYGWAKYAHETQKIFPHDVRAESCAQCGECDAKCPQSIPISAWMPVIHKVLGEGGDYVTSLQ
ncbi:MAG: aldo/keto reductase [Spirochaetales bacterium]|nr:aldo/keto reductase [Spirochaetales bacterium]